MFEKIFLGESVSSEERAYEAPQKFTIPSDGVSIFLAGSIEMGKAIDWQTSITKTLIKEFENIYIVNPRRKDWDCVDIETKAVTIDGIKSLDDLQVGDLILTWNKHHDNLEYQTINALNVYDVENSRDISRFVRNNDKFLFTNNHNHVSRKASRDDSYDFYTTNKIINTNERKVRAPSGRKLAGIESTILIPEGNKFSEDHFKLAAWILAEGSIFYKTNTNECQITIAQYIINSAKVDRIKSLLDRLDITYRYDNRQFILHNDAIHFIIGILELEKYKLPNWIKHSTSDMKKIFIEEYAYGDGCYVDKKLKYIAFSEKYRFFAESMQILAFEAGLSSKIRNKTSGFGHPVININFHNFGKKNYSFSYNGNESAYTGKVWCPTTDNSTWVAYRNGTPFITGNSSWKQTIEDKQFNEQVTWELTNIENSDAMLVYFDKDTQSPITLAELGLACGKFPDKVIVCCPEGFFRKGNVDILCHRYGVEQIKSLKELPDVLKKKFKKLKESK
jgi:hypothetical protein